MILEDNFGVIALGIRPPDFLYIRQDDVIQLMESIKSEKKNNQVMGPKTTWATIII